MPQVISKYHRLFEVRLLHEYFLLGEDRLDFFTEPAAQRSVLLQKRVQDGNYKLVDDLVIIPTIETKKIIENYRLKFKQTSLGMIVGSEGTTNSAGVHFPKINLNAELEMNFRIQVKNSLFKNYTLIPFKQNTPGNYFFSNQGQPVKSPNFKSLSQPIPEFVSGAAYVAGELANHTGILKEAMANTNNAGNWITIEESGFINENDRTYFPKSFQYFPEDGQGDYVFELEDDRGIILKKIEKSITNGEPFKLDFSRVKSKASNGDDEQINQTVHLQDGRFKLKAFTPSNDSEQMIFLSEDYNAADLGLINIRIRPQDPDYWILNDDGSLITDPHPIFEIRLLSRRTFWRYRAKNQSKRLQASTPVDAGFFTDENNLPAISNQPTIYLITKIPQKMAWLPVQIKNPGGGTEFFPQPRPSPFRNKFPNEPLPNNEPPGRIYSDIFITTINGKIEVVN